MTEPFPRSELGNQEKLSQPEAEVDSPAVKLAAACRSIDEILKNEPKRESPMGNYTAESRWLIETLEDGSEVQLAISQSPEHIKITVMRTFTPDKDNNQKCVQLDVIEEDGEIYHSVLEVTSKADEWHLFIDPSGNTRKFREGFTDEDIGQFVEAVNLVKQARAAGNR